MWDLGEPEPLRAEPLCGTLGDLVPGFGRLPSTTRKFYWNDPKSLKMWGETNYSGCMLQK